jgi:hypothetical protein
MPHQGTPERWEPRTEPEIIAPNHRFERPESGKSGIRVFVIGGSGQRTYFAKPGPLTGLAIVLGALFVIILFFALSVFLIATLVVGMSVVTLILSSVLRSYCGGFDRVHSNVAHASKRNAGVASQNPAGTSETEKAPRRCAMQRGGGSSSLRKKTPTTARSRPRATFAESSGGAPSTWTEGKASAPSRITGNSSKRGASMPSAAVTSSGDQSQALTRTYTVLHAQSASGCCHASVREARRCRAGRARSEK